MVTLIILTLAFLALSVPVVVVFSVRRDNPEIAAWSFMVAAIIATLCLVALEIETEKYSSPPCCSCCEQTQERKARK